MKNDLTIYVLSHCSTCQNTLAALKEKQVDFILHDLRKQPLTRDDVTRLAAKAGGAAHLFSRRAQVYKSLNLNDRDLTETEMIDLMSAHDTLIKRPVIESETQAHAGVTSKSIDKAVAQAGSADFARRAS